MSGTFTSELAAEGGRWWAWIEIEGRGRRTGATVAAHRDVLRVSTIDPKDHGWTAADGDSYFAGLRLPPTIAGESIDLRRGVTLLGDLQFEVVDGPRRDVGAFAHGWGVDMITDMLATDVTVNAAAPWDIAADVPSAASGATTRITFVSRSGIVDNQALWIGGEVWIVTDPAPGAGGPQDVDVLRGQYNTTGAAHKTRANGGEGFVYDHPRFVRGLDVRLYLALFDSRTGDALAEAQGRLIWRGTIDEWEMVEPGSFLFACKPNLGRIDRAIGREQWNAQVGLHHAAGNPWTDAANDKPIWLSAEAPRQQGTPSSPQYTYAGAGANRKQDFFARWGDGLIQAAVYQESSAARVGILKATRAGLLDTKVDVPTNRDRPLLPFCDVLLTSRRPHRQDDIGSPLQFFTLAGTATENPIDIALALITSTGSGANGDWDMLPEHWGAGVLVAELNTQTFIDMKGRFAHVSMPNLVIGWEGKPVRLREWLEKNIFGPMGCFLYMDHNGLIALGYVGELYDPDTLPTITEADIVDDSARMSGQLGETITWQTWKYDKRWGEKDDFVTVRRRDPASAERYPGDDSGIEYDADGLDGDLGGDNLVQGRALIVARMWSTPLPRVFLSVGLHRLELDLTAGVQLTCSTLLNPFTGTRGLTAQPAHIVGRSINFERGTIDLELMLARSENVGLWAPAGTVSAYGAGPPVVVAFNANDHSKPANAPGRVPVRDSLGFTVGDTVMLLDSDLQVRSANAPAITDVEHAADGANTIRLDAAFSVAANAGDVVAFPHYVGGSAPAAAWSSSMKDFVVMADNADDELPNADPGYLYGV